METCDHDRARPAQYGFVVDRCEYLDVVAHALDPRRANEHGREGRSVDVAHVEIGFEAVDLPPPRVATHANVDDAELALIGSSVQHVRGQQNHAGARAEGG